MANISELSEEARLSVITIGAVPHLVRLLNTPAVSGKAARALRFLCRHPDGKVACEKAGALLPLVELLHERNDAVTRIEACGALGNIATEQSLTSVVWGAGPFPHLVQMLNSSDTRLYHSTTSTLWGLSSYVTARSDINKSLHRFLELLSSDDRSVRQNVSGILSNIWKERHLRVLAVEQGAVTTLVRLIQSQEDIEILRNAIPLLSRLATVPSAQATRVWSGCILKLIGFLSSNMPPCSDATVLLWNLAFNEEGREAIAFSGGIPALVKLLSGSTETIRDGAVGILRNLTSSSSLRSEVIRAGAIGPLVGLVGAGRFPSQTHAVAALWALFDKEEGQRAGLEARAIPILLELMKNQKADWPTRMQAAAALRSISTGREGKNALAAAGGLKDLIACLDPNDEPTEKAGRISLGRWGGLVWRRTHWQYGMRQVLIKRALSLRSAPLYGTRPHSRRIKFRR